MNTRAALLEHNPFASSTASKPWENRAPDVPSIHQAVFDGITGLIQKKITEPEQIMAGIIFGEAGFGKTHLTRRILKHVQEHAQKNEINVSLVYVDPIINTDKAMRYLLRAIITDLNRKISEDFPCTYLHQLVAKIVIAQLKEEKKKIPLILLEKPCEMFKKEHLWRKLISILRDSIVNNTLMNHPEVDMTFLKVLLQLGKGMDRLVFSWLRGDVLDKEDAQKLGVPDKVKEGKQELEESARRSLISIGCLMKEYQQLIVICFDQIENLTSEDQKTAFSSMVFTLCNEVKGTLPLTFCRYGIWEDSFKSQIDPAVVGRLESNAFEMRGCSVSDAHELIKSRIQSVFKNNWEEPYYFVIHNLNDKIKNGYSPRQVIMAANLAIRGGQETLQDPMLVLQGAYLKECDALTQNLDKQIPDEDMLCYALHRYFQGKKSIFDLIYSKGRLNLTGKIEHNGVRHEIACIVNTQEHFTSIGKCFTEGLGFLERNPHALCYYITDPRCQIVHPSWKKTVEKMEAFLKSGGKILSIPESEIARWYALTLLCFEIPGENIQIMNDTGSFRSITKEDLDAFINSEYFGEPLLSFEGAEEEPPKEEQPDAQSGQGTHSDLVPGGTKVQTDDDAAEGEKYLNLVTEFYKKLKFPVEPLGYIIGHQFIRLKIIPDYGQNVLVNKLVNRSNDLMVFLKIPSAPLIQPTAGYVSIDIPQKNPRPLLLSELLENQTSRPESDVAFPLGVAIDGSVFWVDLAKPEMPHILIAGTSGSGKSVLLRSIILGLASITPPGRVLFTLIDPKRVSFTDLTHLPCLDGPIVMDPDEVIPKLDALVAEMEKRYKMFEVEKVKDIKEWHDKGKNPLAERVIIIDEYADLIINKETKEPLEQAIQRIGQKGRAAGLHLIVATQRPEAKVVTGIIKANLQLKIALKVTSRTNSQIILDEGGAEKLIGRGDLLVGGSIGIERLQCPLATTADIEKVQNCESSNIIECHDQIIHMATFWNEVHAAIKKIMNASGLKTFSSFKIIEELEKEELRISESTFIDECKNGVLAPHLFVKENSDGQYTITLK